MIEKQPIAPLLLVVTCFALAMADARAAIADATWNAGTASVNITPDQFMWMSGYASRTAPAHGKVTDLSAKALALEDASGARAILITLDLVGIDRRTATSICESLRERYGLARQQVALCTSHTHTGPIIGRNLAALHYLQVPSEQQKLCDEYTAVLERKIVEVVGQALDQLAPSRLTWGSGRATFAVNRRENKPYDSVAKWRAEDVLKGPVDHDVPVLAVRDLDGTLKTIVFGYACHSTVLSLSKWSGDYPGFAQIELEESHPGCIAMFWAGCGGDQNPLPRHTVELAEHYGRRLAMAVDSVLLTSQMLDVPSRLRTHYTEVDLPLDTLPTRGELQEQSGSSNRYIVARAKMLLAQIDGGEPLSQTYPYPIALWRLGDEIQFVILGGEVVVDYAIRLKLELSGNRTWVAGYSNDVMAYIPSRRVLLEGGYEGGGAMVYYGLPTPWAPGVEKVIVDAVHALCK